jgi:hypothetical protein
MVEIVWHRRETRRQTENTNVNLEHWEKPIYSTDFSYPRRIGKAGASKIRRLILLLSVGYIPPYLHPSGACLNLGASILYKPHNAAEGSTTPGLRLFRCTLKAFSVQG